MTPQVGTATIDRGMSSYQGTRAKGAKGRKNRRDRRHRVIGKPKTLPLINTDGTDKGRRSGDRKNQKQSPLISADKRRSAIKGQR